MRKLFYALALLFLACPAMAGNVDTFGIGSKATALGGAFSAYADDPFAVYYNPAGLTQVERPTLSVGALYLNPHLKVHSYRAEDGDGNRVEPYGASFSDTSDSLVVPHLGFATHLFGGLYFGIAAYVPYGLHIKWESEPSRNPGAYNGFESYYVRGVVTPTLALKVTDRLSLGLGLSFGRSDAATQRRIYSPSIPSLHNRVIKGELHDDFNVSFNVGLLYRLYDNLSLACTYRSRTNTTFTGTVEVVGVDKVGASTSIDHPEQLQLGLKYEPNERLKLTADVVWTNWSVVRGYTVKFDRPLLGKGEEHFPRDWKDTRQIRLGVEYKVSELLTLRGGYFYDPSPIPDHTFDMLWPDADKKTYSFGWGLNFLNGRLTLDGVLQYIVAEQKREIGGESENLNGSYPGVSGNPGTVSMSADGHLWGYGLTLTYRF
jgi:long-chain fatty acid transport protein